mgnify:CR=1 FL=1|tara:strand:- start:1335 stop:2612 length:1278 start_codon:yes stop_codon:yes gene_type:complete
MMKFSDTSFFALLTLSLWFGTSCAPKNEFISPPPPQVEVENPIIEDTRVYLIFPGRVESTSRVEVRARVTGFLKSREFQAGDYLKEGAPLFTIEPEQFLAAVETAKGNLRRVEADLKIASTNVRRLTEAFKTNAVSELEKLKAEAEEEVEKANVAIAKAALSDAERDLEYTNVTAPISGRVSRSMVDQGNLVGANEPTLLTTMVKSQPMYFNFEVSERAVIPYLPDLPNADDPSMEPNRPEDSQLELLLSDGTMHTTTDKSGSKAPELGKIEFVDNTINEKTGTMRLRALFQNKDEILVDGAFGRIRIPKVQEKAVKVPVSVVQRDLGGNFVLVVGEDNTVERRVVVPTEYLLDEYRIIEAYDSDKNTGVKADEQIVVGNLQRARPGIEVIPINKGENPEPVTEPVTDPTKKKDKADGQTDKAVE